MTSRREYLREHLAALDSYGNGDDARAAAIRAELDQLDQAEPKPKPTKKAVVPRTKGGDR